MSLRSAIAFSLTLAAFVACPIHGGEISFDRDIRPILSDNCFHCHGYDEKERKAGLRLDTFDGATSDLGGNSAIVPGDLEASELVFRIETDDPDEIMPTPGSHLTLDPHEKELLKRWITSGAEYEGHWAYEPVERPSPPKGGHPVDHYIDARLASSGIEPSEPASARALARRLSLDLTGLPLSPERTAQFVNEDALDRGRAVTDLLDELFASPHYGERMAWDWLDVSRYADTNGYQGDRERTMWPWRDWVSQAFQENMSWDQFTIWQIAGDLLPDPTPEQILATAFNRNHPINGEGGRIAEENRVEYVFDMTETVGITWLGLTLECSRCHDHKFDPISQRDYFSLNAFFNQTPVDGSNKTGQAAPFLAVPSREQAERKQQLIARRGEAQAALAALTKSLAPERSRWEAEEIERLSPGKLDDELVAALTTPREARSGEQRKMLDKAFGEFLPEFARAVARRDSAVKAVQNVEKTIPKVMVMEDREEHRPTYILERGLYNQPGEAVSAAIPTIFGTLPGRGKPNRLDLARWLVAGDNPLSARVTVNRFWQMFFGTGLVKTSEDFGVQGERPTHPKLLDWLAAEFVESGWDVQHLIRHIVTSRTYQRSSVVGPEQLELDPDNRLLARSPRHRLPSWMLRDQALAASGLLVDRIGGAPVKPYQPEGIWEEATFGAKTYQRDEGEALYRRTLYTFWRRIVGPPVLFDSAKRLVCDVLPSRTNTPLHALTVMNDTAYVEASRVLVQNTTSVSEAFERVVGRPPHADELALLETRQEILTKHYEEHPGDAASLLEVGDFPVPERIDAADLAARTAVANLLFNLDEVLCRP